MSAKVLFIPHGGGGGGGGEVNDGQNVGTGPGEVYRDKTGTTLNFRTLESQDGSLDISTAGNTVNLEVASVPPLPYIAVGYRDWVPPPNAWLLPFNGDPAEFPPDNLKTVLGEVNGFTLLGGGTGDGGRVEYTGTETRVFRIGITLTTVRPSISFFDSVATYYVGIQGPGGGGFTEIPISRQSERYNIVESDVVVHVEALAELQTGSQVALMATSVAPPLSSGLRVRIDGYSLVITSV